MWNGGLSSFHTTHSAEETASIGLQLAKRLQKGAIVCFFGDLGSGKTTFIKGMAEAYSTKPQQQVHSPTFVYLNIYDGQTPLYHFDLYRLRDADEFLSMGFDEMLYSDGICCIEWSERIASLLPQDCIRVEFMQLEEKTRQIKIYDPTI